MEYYFFSGGIITLVLGSLLAVKVQMAKHPTFHDTEKRYQKKESCDLIKSNIEEKLECLPEMKETVIEIKTKMDILLKQNGK